MSAGVCSVKARALVSRGPPAVSVLKKGESTNKPVTDTEIKAHMVLSRETAVTVAIMSVTEFHCL